MTWARARAINEFSLPHEIRRTLPWQNDLPIYQDGCQRSRYWHIDMKGWKCRKCMKTMWISARWRNMPLSLFYRYRAPKPFLFYQKGIILPTWFFFRAWTFRFNDDMALVSSAAMVVGWDERKGLSICPASRLNAGWHAREHWIGVYRILSST